MYSQSWIQLLIVATLSSAAAATQMCRCESNGEDFYSRRRLTHEIHADNAHFESVKIDRTGYYIVDGVRVVAPTECDYHRTLHAQIEEDEKEDRSMFSYFFSHSTGTVRGVEAQKEFVCDTHTIKTPPQHTGMPESVEKFLIQELQKPKYVMDDHNNMVKVDPVVPSLHKRQDGTPYLVESELECESLPLAVRLNYKAMPFHCRCPENVEPAQLPAECQDSTA